jgi:cytochrome c-type protein NapB
MVNAAMAAEPVEAPQLGLSKSSVFDVPEPESFTYSDVRPKKSESLPRAYPGAPPQIPHSIEDSLPIMAGDNLCLDCHDKPENWDKKIRKGKGTPIPRSHYTAFGSQQLNPDHVAGSRYFCTQCHAPQAQDVKPLVGNDFENVERQ